MPEGPEVKNLVKWLNKNFKYKKILNIKIKSGKYLKNSKNLNTLILNKNIFPLTIENIDCKGKFIYMVFKNIDTVLFITLGMSGWFQIENEKYNHIEFKFKNTKLFFNDFRNFGNIIVSNKLKLNKKLESLGPDILSSKDNYNQFLKKKIKEKEMMISYHLLFLKNCRWRW